ncbi:putative PurR-regulated permease PerM [Anaerosolibacter carboniphilus]|uniref:Putative PurR-regulated permease PerM n=2 Tax=Anaerosolibacter carboniphilus TaxID=1417629 RepID=A0A841KRW2_9FIRM|nr:putative PurR-regulated permease PerM [Anaerosolibacter carboniphilus]
MNNSLNLMNIIYTKPLFYLFLSIYIIMYMLFIVLLCFTLYYLIHIGNRFIHEKNKLTLKKKHLFYLIVSFGAILLVMIVHQQGDIIFQLLRPVVWAIVIAYLLSPMVHFLERKGVKRTLAVILLYTTVIITIILSSITITPKITKEISNLIELLPQYSQQANEFVNQIYIRIKQLDDISPQLTGVKEAIEDNIVYIEYTIIDVFKKVTNSIISTFSHIISLALIPIFSFYFIKDADYFKKKIIFLIPKTCREECIDIGRDIDKLLSKFIRGQIIVAMIVGMLSTVALLILEIDFAFLIGFIAGVSNIIPYVGPIIGAIPAVVIALLDTPMKAIWVVIAFTTIQQVESAILSPKIVGDSVGLHPVVVILSLLVGNEWFGVIGMLFAVPVAASIKIIGKHIINLIVRV